jgi:DNA ligase-associated metallophosphoesterase
MPPLAGALAVERAGESLWLLPERALWWPARATLLVADVHIGKAHSFRRLGVPVPGGSGAETLARLSGLIEALRPRELVVLGDLLHSRHAHDAAPAALLRAWRARHADLALTLVRGNHDDRAGDPPADLGIALVDEPWRVGPFALCHHPQPVPGAYALAGHLHPCVSLGGRAHDRLRLPCFHLGAAVGVLPAFGAFTGMHPLRAEPGDRLFAIADDRVVALPG